MMYQSRYLHWTNTTYYIFLPDGQQWKIYKQLKSGKPEPYRMLHCICGYYPNGGIFSNKHMGVLCYILEDFFNFDHCKVWKWGLACCRHDTSYRISIAAYRYNENIVHRYTGLIITLTYQADSRYDVRKSSFTHVVNKVNSYWYGHI